MTISTQVTCVLLPAVIIFFANAQQVSWPTSLQGSWYRDATLFIFNKSQLTGTFYIQGGSTRYSTFECYVNIGKKYMIGLPLSVVNVRAFFCWQMTELNSTTYALWELTPKAVGGTFQGYRVHERTTGQPYPTINEVCLLSNATEPVTYLYKEIFTTPTSPAPITSSPSHLTRAVTSQFPPTTTGVIIQSTIAAAVATSRPFPQAPSQPTSISQISLLTRTSSYSPTLSDDSSSPSIILIIVGVVVGVLLLAFAVIVCVCLYKKSKKSPGVVPYESQPLDVSREVSNQQENISSDSCPDARNQLAKVKVVDANCGNATVVVALPPSTPRPSKLPPVQKAFNGPSKPKSSTKRQASTKPRNKK